MTLFHKTLRRGVIPLGFIALLIGIIAFVGPQRSGSARAAQDAEQRVQDVAVRLAVIRAQDARLAASVEAGTRSARRSARSIVSQVEVSAAEVAGNQNVIGHVAYQVQAGQDVHAVCELYGLTLAELAAMNPDVDLGSLAADQALTVYRRPADLVSYSRGAPNRGRLVEGVPMPHDPSAWIVRNPRYSWGTGSTVEGIVHGLRFVATRLPGGTIPLVADLSRRSGGTLRPHRSHQSGRDADITYFNQTPGPADRFVRVTSATMDHPRQWALFRYWIEHEMVDYVFSDYRLIRSLYQYASSIGEPQAIMEAAFGRAGRPGILRHERGHSDHLHVRFSCSEHDPVCRTL
jgi:hypothetical protein